VTNSFKKINVAC